MHLLRKRPCLKGNDTQATAQLRLTGMNEDYTTNSYLLLQRVAPAISAIWTRSEPYWGLELAQQRSPFIF
jgi:hypothetical protein